MAWNSLRKMSIAHSVADELPALDFYFLSEYLQATKENSMSSSHFYYLDRERVALIQEGGDPSFTFSESARIISPPSLIFLMVEHQKCFELPFFILFNIQCHEALLMTIGGNQELKVAEQYWFKTIWRGVIKLFGICDQPTSDPTILYGSWIAVSLPFLNERQG
jgi:hypothetical protein